MADDKNLPLRTEILGIALDIEKNINDLLLHLLLINNNERKAITNKSGNLSFQNKIDLLFDLEILNKDEHSVFNLLMQFRNQFLHNIECNSFEYAVKILGPDRGKKLLKFCHSECINFTIEQRYQDAYRGLNIASMKILRAKIKDRRNIIDKQKNILIEPRKELIHLAKQYSNLCKQIVQFCKKNASTNNAEMNTILLNICNVVINHSYNTFSKKEF